MLILLKKKEGKTRRCVEKKYLGIVVRRGAKNGYVAEFSSTQDGMTFEDDFFQSGDRWRKKW